MKKLTALVIIFALLFSLCIASADENSVQLPSVRTVIDEAEFYGSWEAKYCRYETLIMNVDEVFDGKMYLDLFCDSILLSVVQKNVMNEDYLNQSGLENGELTLTSGEGTFTVQRAGYDYLVLNFTYENYPMSCYFQRQTSSETIDSDLLFR